MNRRELLLAIPALAVAAALPAGTYSPLDECDFVLDGPIEITVHEGWLIRNCRFAASPDFVGRAMLLVKLSDPSVHGSIEHCYFDCRNLPEGSYALEIV